MMLKVNILGTMEFPRQWAGVSFEGTYIAVLKGKQIWTSPILSGSCHLEIDPKKKQPILLDLRKIESLMFCAAWGRATGEKETATTH